MKIKSIKLNILNNKIYYSKTDTLKTEKIIKYRLKYDKANKYYHNGER